MMTSKKLKIICVSVIRNWLAGNNFRFTSRKSKIKLNLPTIKTNDMALNVVT